jgi:SAM-dependent methyltransferase
MIIPPDWFALNLANWNERVPIHLNAPPLHYDLDPLRNGTEHLDAIATDILGPVEGLRVLHLQCHFGKDTLTIAQQGASVTGLDFSPPAIAAARSLAADLGLTDRARFVQANIYDAETAINEPGSFDRVFASWGALVWLPDIPAWARIVSSFLKPNGSRWPKPIPPRSCSTIGPQHRTASRDGICPTWPGNLCSKTGRRTTPIRRLVSRTAEPCNSCIL